MKLLITRTATPHLIVALLFGLCLSVGAGYAEAKKPNILVIWGDDVGITNISAYSHGIMGYKTPNIDRIAKEGALFTDYYGEQSCTAGRSSFVTGQLPFRVGLSKVGMPGAKQGISDKDPTIAELLKNHGYVSGQFGKNHLGDRNEYLPTVHGFDEYAGVLYHLNALEEPENVDYPKDPEFFKKFGPRDAIHTWATDENDPTDQPRWGMVGKQKIKSLGQVTKKRMETYDDETIAQSVDFMKRAVKADKPFFIWHNTTRTHAFTHLRKKYADMISEKGFMGAAMTEFDDGIGVLLKELDDLGIADNTIVIISSDNGAMKFSWPDGASSPFRGEKATTWEAGFRVPAVVRWHGVIKPGTVINDIFHHMDWLPTLLAAAGEPDIKEKLLKGHEAVGKTFKVHLDGYNQLSLLKGEAPGTRKEIHYITDDGDYAAFRYKKWKITFLTQEQNGMDVWDAPYVPHRFPRISDLRADPFEEASARNASMAWQNWQFRRAFLLVPAQGFVGDFLASFKEFPPRNKPASFSVGDALKMLQTAPHGK
ncbi:MAG: arylsulfatase [Deltaproteobacteria bacterium]|nr:arylsulfatase [Deltaproteobacteria bacterium]